MSIVFICNNGSDGHEDGFDGVRFKFPVGETVSVPLIAARHMFGYGESDKRPHLVRIGKMKTTTGYEDAMAWLGGFAFSEPDAVSVPDLAVKSEKPKRAKSAAPDLAVAE